MAHVKDVGPLIPTRHINMAGAFLNCSLYYSFEIQCLTDPWSSQFSWTGWLGILLSLLP